MVSQILVVGQTEYRVDPLAQARESFLAGVSLNTRRTYESRLNAFDRWSAQQEKADPLVLLKNYTAYLTEERHLKPRSVQGHLIAIKGMIKMAAQLNPSDERLVRLVGQLELVKAPKAHGEIVGKRLSEAQAARLLDIPGTSTLKGLRDTAILGLLLTLGLRRSEVCNLTWGHFTEVDGHPVIANLTGKHGRTRTMKLPKWLVKAIKKWGKDSGADMSNPAGRVFRPMARASKKHPLGAVASRGKLSDHSIYKMVAGYCHEAGLPAVKPHDLRRTAALLSRRGGASIEQVQVMLGHASPQTTSHYIGEQLNLEDNAVDYNPLKLRGKKR